MRLNLRHITQLIREAHAKAVASPEKSATSSWPLRVAQDFFLDIEFTDAMAIAQGRARLQWDAEKREVSVVAAPSKNFAPRMAREPRESRAYVEPSRVDEDLTDLRAMARTYFLAGFSHGESGDIAGKSAEKTFAEMWSETPNYTHWRDETAHELRVRELIRAAAAYRRDLCGDVDTAYDRLCIATDDVILQGDR